MSKAEAVIALMNEARFEGTTNMGAKRTVQSCKALGIEGEELLRVLSWLDFADKKTGEPYNKTIKRIW